MIHLDLDFGTCEASKSKKPSKSKASKGKKSKSKKEKKTKKEETEAQKKRRLEKEEKKKQKEEEKKKRREAEKEQRKEFAAKVADAKKAISHPHPPVFMSARCWARWPPRSTTAGIEMSACRNCPLLITSNLYKCRLRGADAHNALSKPLKQQRGRLQKARDSLQKGIDEFEDWSRIHRAAMF